MAVEKSVYSMVFAAAAHAASMPGLGLSPCTPKPLSQAHMAYVRGDYQEMTAALKTLFEAHPRDEGAQENALELLEKTYESLSEGTLPVDWTLPESVRGLQLILRRDNTVSSVRETMELRGFQKKGVHFSHLRLVRHPRELLLDMQEDDFDRDVEDFKSQSRGGFEEFSLSRTLPRGPGEGLYYLQMDLSDGTRRNLWFLLSKPRQPDSVAHSREIEELARMGWVKPEQMRMNTRQSRSFGSLRIQWETHSVVRFLSR